MACSSGCRTKNHKTYGECMRSKTVKVAEYDVTAQKAADANLDNYARARKYGIQPQSTKKHHVDQAIAISEQTGQAYQA